VNGIESPIGGAQYDPSGGDRIWWDYRDWTAAMRVPAGGGAWPEPFLHGFRGERWRAPLTRPAASGSCGGVGPQLPAAGRAIPHTSTGGIGVEMGAWPGIHDDPPADSLAAGPDSSGVFARFVGVRTPVLELLNQQGQPAGSLGKGGGLIAALRPSDGPP